MNQKSFFLKWFVAFLFLVLFDFVWFSVSFKRLYKPQFVKMQKRVYMRIWSAILVWLLLGFLVSFLLQKIDDPKTAAYTGLIVGFVVYGVYNFTNYATLINYSLSVAVIDSIWGAFALGTVSLLIVSSGFLN